MPKCKNDEKKIYIGTEPSPKGRGWCAHAEKLGTIKKGLDGVMWRVVRTIDNTKRWKRVVSVIKNVNCKSVTKCVFADSLSILRFQSKVPGNW